MVHMGSWYHGSYMVITLCVVLAAGQSHDNTAGVQMILRIAGGIDTQAQNVPWHAAIYRHNPSFHSFDLHCGATLIAANLIVTAAQCVADNLDVTLYRVALGKVIVDWDPDEEGTQTMEVKAIKPHHRYRGANTNYEYDVALVTLTTSAVTTAQVQVAKLDMTFHVEAALESRRLTEGVVAGWGLTAASTLPSDELQSVTLPYIDEDACYYATPTSRRSWITRGKFCAGYVDDVRSVCRGDAGGGYVVQYNNENYVVGVASTNLRPVEYSEDTCYAAHYTTFTSLNELPILYWIDLTSKLPAEVDPTPTTSTTHSTTTPTTTTSTTTSTTPAPQTFCPAVVDSTSSVSTHCKDANGVTLDCAVPMRAGFKVTQRCRPGFFSTDGRTTWTTTCEATGVWSGPGFQCLLKTDDDCGKQDDRVINVLGEEVKNDQPWLVVIYFRMNSDSDWRYRAVGTLISDRYVVTAVVPVTYASGPALPADKLQLAVGKHFKNFRPSERYTQTRDVRSVKLHEQFDVLSRVYDVALLEAENNFLLSPAVAIACVDWSGLLQPPTQQHVVISAAERRGQSSTDKQFATQGQVPLSHAQCTARALPKTRKYAHADNICAVTSDSATCRDVGGAGLMVQQATARGPRYFLQGVASSFLAATKKDGCSVDVVTSYSDVSRYSKWMKTIIRST